jgi:hypothetical protein
MATPPHRLRKTLGWYTLVVALVITLLIGIVLAEQDSDVLSSIGLNLIGSAVFGAVFVAFRDWAAERNILESIEERFTALTVRVEERMAQSNQLFMPQKSYPPVNPPDSFGDEYNTDVTRSLETSSFFAFHGPSARYVAARLLRAQHRVQEIKVAMISPANHRAIGRRASDRAGWLKFAGKPVENVETDLREELLINVVSLFDCRRICPVDIMYNEDTAVYRYVMFEDSVYLSWYHGPQSLQMEMPESYQFGNGSFIYSSLRLDLWRKFEMSVDKIHFNASQDDAYLMAYLEDLTRKPVSRADLARWRAIQRKDSLDFTKYMDSIYGALDTRSAK